MKAAVVVAIALAVAAGCKKSKRHNDAGATPAPQPVVTVTADAAPPPRPAPVGFTVIARGTSEAALVPATSETAMLEALLGRKPASRFTPSEADVDAAERALAAEAAKQPRGKALSGKLGGYQRQYLGFVENGHRKLYGNFFCQSFGDWKTGLVMVDDGGDCYFSFVFDLDDGTYSQFMINGEA